jgi:sphingomyelin phosphodiesterase
MLGKPSYIKDDEFQNKLYQQISAS